MIGLGPGHEYCMSPQARTALMRSEVVLGYKTYVEQVSDLLGGKEVVVSGMTHEINRAERALKLAMEGRVTALVSGGDPGVYAMAGVVFEVAASRKIGLGSSPGQVDIEVIPGIPALAAAASRLGAPLTHDFACISLSDRLTPWELIEKRLAMAAEADFVIVLYNPKSRGRNWQFGAACEIVSKYRPTDTPVGFVSKAMRKGQKTGLSSLEHASDLPVDMQTLVIIGNSNTFIYDGWMVTPRGYLKKYPDQAG